MSVLSESCSNGGFAEIAQGVLRGGETYGPALFT